MTQKDIKYNSLNLRGISKNTPPSHLSVADNNKEARGVRTSLLHRAFAPCSRAFLCLMLVALPLVYAGCEKDHYPESPGATRSANDSTSEGGLSIVITVDTAWLGDTTIYFD